MKTRFTAIVLLTSGAFVGSHALAQESQDCDTCPAMVDLPSGQAMSATPITVGEFRTFAEATELAEQAACFLRLDKRFKETEGATWEDPGFEQGDDHPVICVTWLEATAYADWLSEMTGQFYRLPTLEEFSEAALAGGDTEFWWGDDFSQVCEYANSADVNYRAAFPEDPRKTIECDDGYSHTSPVRAYPANAYGLHDMAGNVWQWTNSCKEGDCSNAIFRGASWNVPNPKHFRIEGNFADRILLRNDSIGFRVIRDPE